MLADNVLGALSKPNKQMFGFVRRQKEETPKGVVKYDGRAAARSCYADIRNATRYVVSNDLIDYLVDSYMRVDIDSLTEKIIDARLPHQNMWIEWDERYRQKQMKRWAEENNIASHFAPENEILPHVGYLLSQRWIRDDSNPALSREMQPQKIGRNNSWFAQAFMLADEVNTASPNLQLEIAQYKTNRVVSSPIGFAIHPDLDSPHRYDVEKKNDGTLSIKGHDFDSEGTLPVTNAVIGEGYLSGQRQNELSKIKGFERPKASPDSIKNLLSGVTCWQSHASGWMNQKQSHNWQETAKNMMGGDARFLILVLAALNYDWLVKDQATPGKGRKVRYGKILPRSSHITLRVDLPKARGVTLTTRTAVDGAMRREHEVRGHWRVYKKTGKRSWVKSHKRGNRLLGSITKDYDLRSRR